MDKDLAELQTIINKVIEFFVNYSFQVVGAIIILVLGYILGRWTATLINRFCDKKGLDVTLTRFLASMAKGLVIVFAVIIALSKFGITITPFIAAIGAVAFGATYAIQGPLSNYGAGIAIILGRPFVVGDTISVAGVFGIVDMVRLAYTTLVTEDGVKITIPNKHIVGEILHNSGEYRVVEGKVGISYSADSAKAIQVILDTLGGFAKVATEPGPQVGIENFGDSSVDIGYRYWVPTREYFKTLHAVNLAVYNDLAGAAITIPFPQREVLVRQAV